MKFIVTTTINEPTEALIKFAGLKDWQLIVVGDTKTPKDAFSDIDCIYLDTQEQEKINKKLSDLIGFSSLERRNFGYIYAYKNEAEIIASVDDDNIPYDNWGKDLNINKNTEIDYFDSGQEVFDPLSVTSVSKFWHRGFPIEFLQNKNSNSFVGKKTISPKVQADLWDGDPDVDAICRISYSPEVKIEKFNNFSTRNFSPFNTQNTFFSADIMKYFMQLPFVGRMSDIWGSYLLQKIKPDTEIIYCNPSVYQKRNQHDLSKDLEDEILGYKYTLKFLRNDYSLPKKTIQAFELYQKSF